ncbi:MAG TPA: YdiU family protein [Burkholderiales bacterium]|nr:YdiU family protein [Burkholderiales bacterium]
MAAVLTPERPVDLSAASFRSSFVDEMPADPLASNTRRQVPNASYTRVTPTPVAAPNLLAWSQALAGELGLARPSAQALEALAGNRVFAGMAPYASRYGGHQFGVWARQLGDGRAITLGELVARDGSRQELQLKGAGLTPYSRTADGRAVLRSSLREYLCSEAMHFLGVPTTRALSLVGTGESVIRDMFYDGNPEPEPGAVVCRVAPSFLRFGNFEIHAAHGEQELLKRLLDYVIRHFYPGLSYRDWYHEVCRRTARLMADWMRLGFVHGVMNTDNMSVLGLTIDYGPYGWLEGYDPAWTPNTTDNETRRYCYGNQPQIGLWNLARLAEALLPLIAKEDLEAGLEVYGNVYQESFSRALAQKLGLAAFDGDDDEALLAELFQVLNAVETDFTLFFRGLSAVREDALVAPLARAFYAAPPATHVARLEAWLRRWLARGPERARMNAVNPKYVPRNYLAQQAIDAMAAGDASVLERLMRVLERPYDEQPGHDDLAERRPEWARHKPGCSALSCSS